MEKIAIYYRVSTDKQDLESQKVAIEKWLAELPKSPKSVQVFQDEGVSGKTMRRPGFIEMMKMAMQGSIDTIVVYRLDRFSRNATAAIKTILEIDEYGVGFISVTQPVLNLGNENPFRRTLLAAFAEIAEIERDTIVARVKSGLEAARKRGTRLGAPQKLTCEKQAEAKRLREQGQSFRDIAKAMDLSIGSVNTLINGPAIPPLND